jgi:hypothetical protein
MPKRKVATGIDKSKPLLSNKDGSFSTERTITTQIDGDWYNIPTIVGGKDVGEKEAIKLFKSGDNESVGKFKTLKEAENAAKKRSKRIAKVRGLD